jgi:hypothetical protein
LLHHSEKDQTDNNLLLKQLEKTNTYKKKCKQLQKDIEELTFQQKAQNEKLPEYSQVTFDEKLEQQKILLNVIQQSAKRLNRTSSGGANYIDYGQETASKFQNKKGSPSTWEAAWAAITFDMKFAMATLLGKFDWNKNSDGTYTITDKYTTYQRKLYISR